MYFSQNPTVALLPFATICICKTVYSDGQKQNWHYKKLDAEPDIRIRIQLSLIKLNIKYICGNKKQYHSPH